MLRSVLAWPSGRSGNGTDGDLESRIAGLIRAHRAVHPRGDLVMLRRAYVTAERAHRGQRRKSGQPYITHPLAVAEILADLGMDTTTLVAALLHDTVEDTDYELYQLKEDFGFEVARLVDGVTKFDKVSFGDAAEAETIRKMIVAAGEDVRVLIIKVADRLHNMRTLDARSSASRTRIAKYTQDWLIPLCDRLGIQALKRELEDCVLLSLEPEWYEKIDRFVTDRPKWTPYLNDIVSALETAVHRNDVDADVAVRPRHHYSIWRDSVKRPDGQPFDLPRVEVVVDGPPTDCYAALGAVHGLWRPVPGRFKDFIATPKDNLYQSLHTTVLGPDQEPVEVLIRTEQMHTAAEYGIVTQYRADVSLPANGRRAELEWLRRMLDWEEVAEDPRDFLQSLRRDLTYGQIQAFTPDGRPVPLPVKATPVDFAYTLDTLLGHRCVAARINGRLVPLSSRLADGDVVEILTTGADRGAFPPDPGMMWGPSREWLSFVRTPHAQLQISRWFDGDEEHARGLAAKVRAGRAAVNDALRSHDRTLATDMPLVTVADKLGYPDIESLLLAIAERRRDADELALQLIAEVDQPR